MQNVGVASVGPTSRFRGLGELVGEYIEERSSSNEWQSKTALTVRAALDDLIEILGKDTDVARLTRKQLVAFRKKLQQLPSNRKKLARYRDKTVRQILAMPNVKPMALETLRKRMTWASTFLKWCVQQDYLPKNPAEGLIPKRREGDSSEARDPFSHDELTALVAALAAHEMGPDIRHERFWSPLIALYNGMRQNEICQLYCDDVREVGGVWCFDINLNTPDKRVKTPESVRIVPIHSALQRLGFLDYVASLRRCGLPRLWPSLKQGRDGYARAVSRWFTAFNHEHVVNHPRKVFHSLRHTFINTLKQAGVQEVAIAELVGHKNANITTGRYGKRLEPGPLAEAVEKADYDLDLSALRRDWP
ncbi:MAG: site-specific integrase [Verrucomicrobia bacterium]|nr:site-specific integrase [Verrucomicrobiota bacterium]